MNYTQLTKKESPNRHFIRKRNVNEIISKILGISHSTISRYKKIRSIYKLFIFSLQQKK